MPPVTEQLALPDSQTNPNLLIARFLLKPGRKYEDAVLRFSPYEHIQDPYPEARVAALELVKRVRNSGGPTRSLIYLNNRIEGNALESIAAVVDGAKQEAN